MKRDALIAVTIAEAKSYLQEGATIRSVAREFGRSNATVAYDLRNRVKMSGRPDLQEMVDRKLTLNASEAPYLGGAAMKSKGKQRRCLDGNE